ncbi:hypothetical protein DQ237_19165 [Blastococcus sp. TF02-8]|uniref:hypothetical protein n=1 Tax=Blastococcus sp. TF02-8 TaxID=2250574 RepID=UPI000DE97A7F|nr:hypothetical protein [Blastococcus sp. TF02-8]RBY91933.1 hypothetical protein DQ237_19165 [Blastococcus sp. TF02-8]
MRREFRYAAEVVALLLSVLLRLVATELVLAVAPSVAFRWRAGLRCVMPRDSVEIRLPRPETKLTPRVDALQQQDAHVEPDLTGFPRLRGVALTTVSQRDLIIQM